jgi:hypothetical protein
LQNDLFFDNNQKRGVELRPFRWRARQIGAEANRLVALPSFEGTILALFSKTVYLSGRDGKILWLSKEGLPMHRRCILVPFQTHPLCPGQVFSKEGSLLKIGEAVTIELNQAEPWRPFMIGPGSADPMFMVNERVSWLFSILLRNEQRDGFGPALPVLSAIAAGREPETVSTDPFFSRAIDPILAIAEACLCKDIVRVAQEGRKLIGLGPGLTPSGDDFLGGLFFALNFLKTIFPEKFFWNDGPILELIDWSSSRTNPISHAIFSDLCVGHGPEPLYDLLNFLLSGGDQDKILPNMDRLCEIGHTSGRDVLAGLLTGMLMVRGKGSQLEQEARA